jgi:hypothetical protein
MKNYPEPKSADTAVAAYSNPAIENYGKVGQLPNAAQQPRDGSKIVVDVTTGDDAARLNPGIEKLSRFVNIYAAAGKVPAKANIAVVLQGPYC